MSGRVMRKFRHAGKKAVKFRFSATVEKLVVEGTRAWQPHKLAVVWTRRKRRKSTTLQSWRPGIENPYKGAVEWSKLNPEILEIEVTLFKEPRRGTYETKDWVFVLENEAQNGKRKAIATARIDMTDHVSEISSPKPLQIRFKPLTSKLGSANLTLTMRCEFLKEGAATDPDMASLAGSTTSEDTIRLGSVDVCDFTEFDDMDGDGLSKRSGSLNSRGSSTKHQILELTQQIEMFSKGFKEDSQDVQNHADGTSEASHPSATNDNTRSSSRQASISSSVGADKVSLSSSKSSHEKGDEPKSEKDTKRESISEKDKESKRNSSASESAGSEPSPIQKRRLRTSVDVVPSRPTDNLAPPSAPINYGSPASELHRPLLHWCQLVTTGYRGVKVTNFTTSWRNGLAFCAVLHYMKPEAIDYSELKPLDGRDNLKKAFKGFQDFGFNTEEISKAMRTNSGGIATKAIIISFLTEVKEYFDKNDMGDTVEILKKGKVGGKQETKHNRVSLADFMKEKLLSDLVEKEGEDDVFSCVLDDVLESETGLDVLHLSISDETDSFAMNGSLELPDVSYMNDSTRLSTISENPCSATSLKTDREERMNSFLLPATEKITEKEKVTEDSQVEEIFKHDETFKHEQKDDGSSSSPPQISLFETSTPLTLAIEEDELHTVESHKGARFTPEKPHPAFQFSPGSRKRVSITPPSSPAVKTEELSNIDVDESLADVASSLATIQNMMEAKVYSPPPTDQLSSSAEVIPLRNSSEKIAEKPMSEKRVKALALIEQFKAESTSKKNEDWKTMSLSRNVDGKRREEVKERAKKLIEQTRASLDIKPSGYSYSTEAINMEPKPNGILPSSNTNQDKFSTLPTSRKSSWKEDSRITEDAPQNIEDLSLNSSWKEEKFESTLADDVVSAKINDDSEQEKSISVEVIPESDIKIFSFDREVMKEESAIPHAKLVPVSPTRILSFSDFQKVENVALDTKTEEVQASPEVIPSKEETKMSKIETASTAIKSSDYNGNSVPTEDSRYLLINSQLDFAGSAKSIEKTKLDIEIDEKVHFEADEKIPDAAPQRNEHNERMENELSISEAEIDLAVSELHTENDISDVQDPQIKLKNSYDTLEISLNEFESSVSVLTLGSNNPFAKAEENEAPGEEPVTVQVVKDDENVEEENSKPGSVAGNTLVEKDEPPEIKIEKVASPKEKFGLGLTKTPMKLEPHVAKPVTSTPVVGQSPVKFRNPKVQSKTNGGASPAKSTPTHTASPIRVTTVKPVKMTDLESFSPILSTPTKGQLTRESPRSRPSSVKLSRRKSSTSSIRKSIAANDTSELEKEKLALEEEMRTVDDRSAEVQEELQELKNSGRGKSKEKEEMLMQEWFQLVQKKNAIVRQQDQLLLLEQEHDLGQQMNEINEQMRPYMEIEESQKTEAQKLAEKGLLDQLLCLVNERDRIIRTIDENEQNALEDDMHVQTNLDQNMSKVFNKEEEKCAIM